MTIDAPKRPSNPAGRPKGSRNRTPLRLKEAVAFVFDALGGEQALLAWARKSQENRREFYRLCARLAVREVNITGEFDVKHGLAERLQAAQQRVIAWRTEQAALPASNQAEVVIDPPAPEPEPAPSQEIDGDFRSTETR